MMMHGYQIYNTYLGHEIYVFCSQWRSESPVMKLVRSTRHFALFPVHAIHCGIHITDIDVLKKYDNLSNLFLLY